MFRCGTCGSGYTAQMASSWDWCPRCLAKDKARVPLDFELGWRSRARRTPPETTGAPAGSAAESAATSAPR